MAFHITLDADLAHECALHLVDAQLAGYRYAGRKGNTIAVLAMDKKALAEAVEDFASMKDCKATISKGEPFADLAAEDKAVKAASAEA